MFIRDETTHQPQEECTVDEETKAKVLALFQKLWDKNGEHALTQLEELVSEECDDESE